MHTKPTRGPSSIRRGTVTASSITVHWEEVPCLDRNGEITGYIAEAVKNGVVEETASVSGGARQATISGLSPSTWYTVQVAAVNGAGTGPYSSGISLTTSDGLSTQVISSSNTSLAISWTLEETLTASAYTISYSNTNNTDCFTDSRSDTITSETTYQLTGLEEGTQYSITVTATLTGGRTEQDTVTATTRTAAPSAPSLFCEIVSGQFN
ncbi:Receptor-type tyrosine-protein phosphatase delta [Geodia barretti]|uniref:Receptor-type tyrosine-protein phosphatase delta n=1 Tax=Geodia barretti TaxID=519541 RepID=A0AA35S8E5_GEOBA|nr:Receptor-type tyrosine-protein phosphatase delta [Geodia barretti]